MDDVLSFAPSTHNGNFCATCEQSFAGSVATCPNDGTVFAEVRKIEQLLFNRYQVMSTVGSGSTGTIYKGKQQPLGRLVAIKMLKIEDAEQAARFKQEAHLSSFLDHPNIIHVYDFGTTKNNQPFMVMDFIDGGDLSELINREGMIPKSECLHIFQQICDGMGHAHKKGIIHRDLKPSNIMLADLDGILPSVRIVDFGIALALGPQSQEQTRTSKMFGSPYYMSPEQALGTELDARSDIYSLGCVMYETLTGTLPIAGNNPFNTLRMHLTEQPIGLRERCPVRRYSEQLENVVMKCLAKEPAKRFQTMEELKKALDTVPENEPLPRRPISASGVMPAAAFQPPRETRKGPSLKLVVLTSCVLTLVGGLSAFCLTQFTPKQDPHGKQVDDLDVAIKKLQKAAQAPRPGKRSQLSAASKANPFAPALLMSPTHKLIPATTKTEVSPDTTAIDKEQKEPSAEEIATQMNSERDILCTSSSTNIFGHDNRRIMVYKVSGSEAKSKLIQCLRLQPGANDVFFGFATLTKDETEPLRNAPRIKHLAFNHCHFSDSVLAPLKDMPQLEGLTLNRGSLSDSFVQYLSNSPHLRILDLSVEPKLTEKVLEHLPMSIEDLHLKQNAELSSAKFAVLAKYPNLRRLDLSETQI